MKLTSRLLLVIAVVIAAFLAAFLGQIFITQLSFSPTLLTEPGIIIRDTRSEDVLRENTAQRIRAKQDGAYVRLFATADATDAGVDGYVISNDGWIVYVQPLNSFAANVARLDSGDRALVVDSVVDTATSLRFVKIERDRLKALSISADGQLGNFSTVYTMTAEGMLATTALLGQTSTRDAIKSADMPQTWQHVFAQEVLNSALYSQQGDLVGLVVSGVGQLSRVITAAQLRESISHVLQTQSIPRAKSGISYADLSQSARPGVDRVSGAYVTAVSGAAIAAGLRAGDVIVSTDGVPLTNRRSLADAVLENQPGDSIELTVLRKTTPLVLTLKLD